MDNEVRKRSENGSSVQRAQASAQVLAKNGLVYKMPQSLSTTQNKVWIRNYSQRTTYSSEAKDTIVIDCQTGSRYIDPENCFLHFELKVDVAGFDGSTVVKFASDDKPLGANSCFSESLITAKNGVELDRITNLNYYSVVKQAFEASDEYVGNVAGLWGVGDALDLSAGTITKKYAVPMKLLSGMFCPTIKGQKLPAALLSGARIEMSLEDARNALIVTAGASTGVSYQILNPRIHMLSHELNDSSARLLNNQSAQNSLEYTFPRCFSARQTSSASQINAQVKKAVSQGLRAFAVSVPADDINDRTADGFDTIIGEDDFVSYQYRIGANHYPSQKVDSVQEAYFTTLNCFGNNHNANKDSPTIDWANYSSGNQFAVGESFESESRLNLTGTPINNSNTLELEMRLQNVPGGGLVHIIFLEYVAVSRSFLTNTTVKI